MCLLYLCFYLPADSTIQAVIAVFTILAGANICLVAAIVQIRNHSKPYMLNLVDHICMHGQDYNIIPEVVLLEQTITVLQLLPAWLTSSAVKKRKLRAQLHSQSVKADQQTATITKDSCPAYMTIRGEERQMHAQLINTSHRHCSTFIHH